MQRLINSTFYSLRSVFGPSLSLSPSSRPQGWVEEGSGGELEPTPPPIAIQTLKAHPEGPLDNGKRSYASLEESASNELLPVCSQDRSIIGLGRPHGENSTEGSLQPNSLENLQLLPLELGNSANFSLQAHGETPPVDTLPNASHLPLLQTHEEPGLPDLEDLPNGLSWKSLKSRVAVQQPPPPRVPPCPPSRADILSRHPRPTSPADILG